VSRRVLPLAVAVLAVALAGALARASRRRRAADRAIRIGLAAALASNELVWYRHVLALGWVDPPRGLPLDLCDLVLWLTVVGLVLDRPRLREVLYFLALAGTGMAVLTPDLGGGEGAYVTGRYFVAHGGIVTAILYLVLSGALRPRPGGWWRALLWVNAYALAIGAFDLATGTNYFYLREKPSAPSLLDVLGPWPWYILGGEAVAALLFLALSLPFRPHRHAMVFPYSRATPRQARWAIDRWVGPGWRLLERHAVEVAVPPGRALDALARLRLGELPVVRALFALRGLASSPDDTVIGFFSARPFALLEVVPGEELVAGVLRLRRAGGNPSPWPGSPADFGVALPSAPFAAIATFRADPSGRGASLCTETWARTRGALPTVAFLAYWMILGPFSAWIRRILLREARARAER
jgi:hypothetical integral membrane protein (TIGR02206 family)